jgi:ABC-type multidrug transport system ATPase subunit
MEGGSHFSSVRTDRRIHVGDAKSQLACIVDGVEVGKLDEPTANLEPLAEAETYRTVTALRRPGGPAIVRVGHRLGADHIAVFHEGRIVESGTHEQLLDAAGLYATPRIHPVTPLSLSCTESMADAL